MLNNPILQVFTGLCFLYLIYSLLATILKEFIASFFSYRSRMLEKGIQQMLDGHNISYYWWDKVLNLILFSFYWIRYSLVAFWNVYSAKTKPPRPAHIKPFLSIASKYPRPRWKLTKKSTMFAAKVVSHPLYQRYGQTTWIKTEKPAYLPAETFSAILIDLFGKNSPTRAGTRLILMQDVITYIQTDLAEYGNLKEIMNMYVQQANGDVARFKDLLEKWYNDSMDRVSGWYKRQANYILFAIGLGLALGFNVDSITIITKLSGNQTAREALIQNAAKFIDSKYKDLSTKVDSSDPADINAKITQIQAIYRNSIDTPNNLLGLGWKYEDPLPGKPSSFTQYWHAKLPAAVFTPVYYSFREPLRILGFILTALAISLGAPFWFDLLNKLVSLRAAGAKPDKSGDSTGQTPTLARKPDPSAKG